MSFERCSFGQLFFKENDESVVTEAAAEETV